MDTRQKTLKIAHFFGLYLSKITHFLGTKWAKITHISAYKGGVKKLGHRTDKKKVTPCAKV